MTPATATRAKSNAQEDASRTAVRLRLEEEMTAAADLARVEEARDALRRLDAGTYGLCSGCRQPIAPERLEFLPTTTTCVRCKSGGLVTRLGR